MAADGTERTLEAVSTMATPVPSPTPTPAPTPISTMEPTQVPQTAAPAYTAEPTPVITATPVPEPTTLAKGDHVFMGAYPQEKPFTEKQPIEWVVIGNPDRKKDTVRLMALYVLDCQPYHDREEAVRWRNTYMHTWLNDQFFSEAFNRGERDHIIPVSADTVLDTVTLLTMSEYNELKADPKLAEYVLTCGYTSFSHDVRGGYVNGNSTSWWLRADKVSKGKYNKSSGKYLSDVPWVTATKKKAMTSGQSVILNNTVRPVITVRLSWLEGGR